MKVQILTIIMSVSMLIIPACESSPAEPCTLGIELSEQAPYPIGFAAYTFDFRFDSRYQNHAVFHFNSMTPGNALKMERLQPAQGQFDFSDADSLVNLALAKGFRVHGHTLVWHNQNPAWLNAFSGDREAWVELLRVHVTTVVQHFSGRIHSWDVVNEAFEDNGELRESPWRSGIGDDYIQLAFQFAAEAEPEAVLFYNDYNLWRKRAKCRSALELFEGLQKEQTPIHGIGFQGHIDIRGPGRGAIEKAMEDFVELGLQVHISELDVSVNLSGKTAPELEAKYSKQAEVYRMVAEAYAAAVPGPRQFGITIWGMTDADSWIPSFFNREDAPLLWDGNYGPKPALCAFVEGM